MSTFLSLPVELRVIIYNFYLWDLQHVVGNLQPSNTHFRILHVCRQISAEASQLTNFCSYVSLIHEDQILAFNANISVGAASRILHADVANDARIVHGSGYSAPASELYNALSKLVNLRRLRVFECSRSRPITDFIPGARFTLQLERAMFPSGVSPLLSSYELYLSPFRSSMRTFEVISSDTVQNLRLSGNCGLPRGTKLPRLTTLAIGGVTGHYLDQHMQDYFDQSPLKEFRYKQGDKVGAMFQLRDHQLHPLVHGSASGLCKLVLLGCTRLSSSCLTTCLGQLQQLRYLALSFVSVHELGSNFITAFPASLTVLKIAITNARYTKPRVFEENVLCDSIERLIIMRNPPLESVHADLRKEVMESSGRTTRWTKIARGSNFTLQLGAWEKDENF